MTGRFDGLMLIRVGVVHFDFLLANELERSISGTLLSATDSLCCKMSGFGLSVASLSYMLCFLEAIRLRHCWMNFSAIFSVLSYTELMLELRCRERRLSSLNSSGDRVEHRGGGTCENAFKPIITSSIVLGLGLGSSFRFGSSSSLSSYFT